MTPQEFERQIDRLNSQWPRTYGQERKALLWAAFGTLTEDELRRTVDLAIAGRRAAPLLDELNEDLLDVKKRDAQDRASGGSVLGVLDRAARGNKTADPDFIKACMKHLRSFLDGKIDRKHFDEGCGYLAEVASKLDPQGSRQTPTAALVTRLPATRRNRYDGEDND